MAVFARGRPKTVRDHIDKAVITNWMALAFARVIVEKNASPIGMVAVLPHADGLGFVQDDFAQSTASRIFRAE